MIDPRFGARCAIRDTRAAGAERYHWTVSLIGNSKPVARSRAGEYRRGALASRVGLKRLLGGQARAINGEERDQLLMDRWHGSSFARSMQSITG